MSVSGGYERSSTNGCVQGFEFCIKDDIRFNALSNAVQGVYEKGTVDYKKTKSSNYERN